MNILRLIFVFILCSCWSLPGYTNSNATLLFIHSYDEGHTWSKGIREGFNDVMKPYPEANVFHEYMDAKRFPSQESQAFFFHHLAKKYFDRNIDALIISDDPAMNFYLEQESQLFVDVPVFFMGINQVNATLVEAKHMAGVFENRKLTQAIIDIKKAMQIDEMIILSDSSSTGQSNTNKILMNQNHHLMPQILHTEIDLTLQNMVERIQQYPANVPIMVVGQLRSETTGELISWHKVFEVMGSQLANPIFAMGVFSMDYGAVAGYQLDSVKHAMQATELILQFLDGTPIEEIQSITEVDSTWYWSQQKIDEFGIEEQLLPDEAVILDFESITYELDRNIVIAYAGLMIAALLIILLLLVIIGKNKASRKMLLEKVALTEKLSYEASHDWLTGLMNRRQLNAELDKLEKINFTSKPNTQNFVAILDLDNFKVVNDTVGHMVGDNLLTEVAVLMANNIGSDDVLARLGGDEFALILVNKTDHYVNQICSKIIDAISTYKLHWNDSTYSVGISIGVVCANGSDSKEVLMSQADMACKKAKESGKNRIYLTDSKDKGIHYELSQIGYVAEIEEALRNDQFYLVKQKILHLTNAGKEHYEILLRYTDKQGKAIPPFLFIPAAEKYGLITLVDEWVVRNVLENYNKLFPSQNAVVSINISAVSLCNEQFLEDVLRIVNDCEIDMRMICFEVTETAVVSHIDKAMKFIHSLKAVGCQFALDDFGSGSASYGYLKQLPVDYLKIDGSLIKGIVTEEIDQTIVQSINDIAHKMGICTIAEFVEDDKILNIIEKIGVDYGQGYGIHMPEPFK